MRVAVYGGSFNPPHVGHAMVASWLLWTGRVDRVWFVPAFAHPFGKSSLPFPHRMRMCAAVAALLGDAAAVCAIEAELPTPSYTIDTLRALQARHPDHRFQPVLGSDLIDALPRWKDWSAIARDFQPIFVGRSGYPHVPDAPTFPDIASTEIRRRLASGEPIDHLVPSAVAALLRAEPLSA